jgi:hypothetical protein
MNKGILIDKSQFFDNFTKKSILASKSPSENRQHHCNPTDCDPTDCDQLIAIF